MINDEYLNDNNDDVNKNADDYSNDTYDNELEIDIDSIEIDIDNNIAETETETIENITDADVVDSDFDILFKDTVNKHKIEGTHSLKHDTIYLGKIESGEEESSYITIYDDNYDIEKGTEKESEMNNYDDYHYNVELAKDIYNLLLEKTKMDINLNRRKPNKDTFNNYYDICVMELNVKYTKCDIFVELSYYFTDNIFNMFKLLNKKNAGGLILELKNKGYLKDISNINFI